MPELTEEQKKMRSLKNECDHARRYIVMMFRNSTEPSVKRIAIEYVSEFMRDDSELIAEMGINPR